MTSNEALNEKATNVRLRRLERHGAASLRAVSGLSDAEYRAQRLRIAGIPRAFAAPYLAIDFNDASLSQCRGVMDSLSLRLAHSDNAVHRELTPASGFSRLVFDVLEQLRCDSLYSENQRGVRANLDAAFSAWCHQAHGDGIADSGLGVLLYTVIHMVRARLIGTLEDETAEALIEATRANLGPLIGHDLYHLQALRCAQRDFAESALRIAMTLEAMIEAEEGEDFNDDAKVRERHAIVLPPDWQDDGLEADGFVGGTAGAVDAAVDVAQSLDAVGDYHVFTTEFDVQVTGDSLFRDDKRQRLRFDLDKLVAAQSVSVPRLARELKQLFADPAHDGWLFGQDEGLIDARRLSQLVSNPEYHQVFVQPRIQRQSNSVVSFLIDNSGSMKRQRFAAVAVLIDTLTHALDLAGVGTEVLGHTTADWNGGRAMRAWRRAGQIEHPGRIGEAMHIVYKDINQSWRRARSSLASLLDTQHFREGLDGEALIWSYRRLQQQDVAKRYLIVISDGAPMDSATHHANRDGFLDDHLRGVAEIIQRRGDVQVAAIGIDLDLSDLYRRSAALDLGGTLGKQSYRVLHELFTETLRYH